jgi:Tol biopolymer transport system component
MFLRVAGKASAAAVLTAAVGAFAVVPVADAAFPGTNGDIAFSSTRDNNIAIYQVNPNAAGIGTSSGDASATSQLTLGAGDVEPFYSPNGQTVVFSSDRDNAGEWVVYSVPQATPESTTNPATELSAVSGDETHNDYSPTFAPDGDTVVFNRDNTSIDTLWAPTGPGSLCTLYTPTEGLLPNNSSDGSGSRVVFDPVDPSKAIFVGADGDLHLLSGIHFTAGSNPCSQQATITDTNVSTAAFPAGSQYATGVDAFPDWSPNGQEVVFNSSRGGGDTLFIINNPTSATPTGGPVVPAQANSGSTMISTEPAFSPDGTQIAFVQSKKGSTVYSEMLLPESGGTWESGSMTNVSAQASSGISFDSEPDWQPIPQPGSSVPESRYVAVLPVAAVLAAGAALGLVFRRRRSTRPTSA